MRSRRPMPGQLRRALRVGDPTGAPHIAPRSWWRRAFTNSWTYGILAPAAAAILAAAVIAVAMPSDAKGPPANADATRASDRSNEAHQPLTVAVQADTHPCHSDWVVPKSPAEVASEMRQDPVETWNELSVAKDGAVAAPSGIQVTVQGRDDAAVVLTGMTVRVHERRPPIAGTTLDAPCGEAGFFRWLEIDLDQQRPKATSQYSEQVAGMVEAGMSEASLRPIKFPYEVSLSDAEIFYIYSVTEHCDCTWTAELSWASAGRTGTVSIDDGGRPFRATSRNNAPTCHLAMDGKGGTACE